jgi:phosphoribosylformylglycinamidine (FGAM) synthase-like enzyme
VTVRAGAAFAQEGDAILVIGGRGTHLGASQYLADILGREEGAPPPVDLAAEWRRGTLVRQLIGAARLTGVHDISSGGLGVALAEMAMAGGIGATVEIDGPAHAALFGEDQGRYVVTVARTGSMRFWKTSSMQASTSQRIGTTGGTDLTVEDILTISVANLKKAHEIGSRPTWQA